jgi:hypothetical protein
MSTFDERARDLSGRKLAPKSAGGRGQAITLRVQTGTTVDDDTQQVTPVYATHPSSGLEELREQADLPGTSIKAGDIKFMLSPYKTDGTLCPELSTQFKVQLADGKWYTVVGVDPYRPAGLVIYTYLWLRTGG